MDSIKMRRLHLLRLCGEILFGFGGYKYCDLEKSMPVAKGQVDAIVLTPLQVSILAPLLLWYGIQLR